MKRKDKIKLFVLVLILLFSYVFGIYCSVKESNYRIQSQVITFKNYSVEQVLSGIMYVVLVFVFFGVAIVCFVILSRENNFLNKSNECDNRLSKELKSDIDNFHHHVKDDVERFHQAWGKRMGIK